MTFSSSSENMAISRLLKQNLLVLSVILIGGLSASNPAHSQWWKKKAKKDQSESMEIMYFPNTSRSESTLQVTLRPGSVVDCLIDDFLSNFREYDRNEDNVVSALTEYMSIQIQLEFVSPVTVIKNKNGKSKMSSTTTRPLHELTLIGETGSHVIGSERGAPETLRFSFPILNDEPGTVLTIRLKTRSGETIEMAKVQIPTEKKYMDKTWLSDITLTNAVKLNNLLD